MRIELKASEARHITMSGGISGQAVRRDDHVYMTQRMKHPSSVDIASLDIEYRYLAEFIEALRAMYLTAKENGLQ